MPMVVEPLDIYAVRSAENLTNSRLVRKTSSSPLMEFNKHTSVIGKYFILAKRLIQRQFPTTLLLNKSSAKGIEQR